MSDHPSTYHARETHKDGIAWNDRASLHKNHDGGGVFDSAKALASGSFAEMIRHVMMLPAEDRDGYVIQKAGDHKLMRGEIEALAAREDFPASE